MSFDVGTTENKGTRFGLKATKTDGGPANFQTRGFRGVIPSEHNQTFYAGDPVRFASNGTVELAASGEPFDAVFQGIEYIQKGLGVPKFDTVFLAGTETGPGYSVTHLFTDSNLIYEVEVGGPLSSAITAPANDSAAFVVEATVGGAAPISVTVATGDLAGTAAANLPIVVAAINASALFQAAGLTARELTSTTFAIVNDSGKEVVMGEDASAGGTIPANPLTQLPNYARADLYGMGEPNKPSRGTVRSNVRVDSASVGSGSQVLIVGTIDPIDAVKPRVLVKVLSRDMVELEDAVAAL